MLFVFFNVGIKMFNKDIGIILLYLFESTFTKHVNNLQTLRLECMTHFSLTSATQPE